MELKAMKKNKDGTLKLLLEGEDKKDSVTSLLGISKKEATFVLSAIANEVKDSLDNKNDGLISSSIKRLDKKIANKDSKLYAMFLLGRITGEMEHLIESQEMLKNLEHLGAIKLTPEQITQITSQSGSTLQLNNSQDKQSKTKQLKTRNLSYIG